MLIASLAGSANWSTTLPLLVSAPVDHLTRTCRRSGPSGGPESASRRLDGFSYRQISNIPDCRSAWSGRPAAHFAETSKLTLYAPFAASKGSQHAFRFWLGPRSD